jgi:hypothetical protein
MFFYENALVYFSYTVNTSFKVKLFDEVHISWLTAVTGQVSKAQRSEISKQSRAPFPKTGR